ncbi:MAG: efflux RND transporter periplasmic adaptor subunit, partial [Sulfuricellaceae bacterium]|nr:efflux RND transporter periplasmic adaptor subunit [Sulfuricellaceae bacterium]
SGLLLAGCGKKAEDQKAGPPAANITVAAAQARTVQILEHSIGEADSSTAPKVAAEVAGRIVKIYADIGDAVKRGQLLAELDPTDYSADAKRLEAQATTQQKLTARYRELAKKGFVSPANLEGVEAQNVAAREQSVRAAKNLARTRIVSPVDGRVDNRMVSVGDWIELGKPLFQLAGTGHLRISLPFPETAAPRIRPGEAVTLRSPTAPDSPMHGKIEQVRPMVGASSRSFDAIVAVDNPGNWKPGSSVDGAVVVAEHPDAVTVPENCVVLRPAGTVVYVVANGEARQRIVTTGVQQQGYVEILSGLKAGETVAQDGAGFLSDKAAVKVSEPGKDKPAK